MNDRLRAAIDDDALLALAAERYGTAAHPWRVFLGDLAGAALGVLVVWALVALAVLAFGGVR